MSYCYDIGFESKFSILLLWYSLKVNFQYCYDIEFESKSVWLYELLLLL